MKKIKKFLILLIFLLILAWIPSFPISSTKEVPSTSQNGRVSFIWGGGTTSTMIQWDPSIVSDPDLDCLEPLLWIDQHATVHPMLALDWTYHARPEEGNMTGGVKSVSMNLRQGVIFHDGSEFNATVVKWNVDRIINISGFVDQKWLGRTWFDPSGLESRYTSTWNLSWADSDPFSLGGKIPFINETIVVSEFVVNFTLNKWALDVFDSMFSSFRMISMESYMPWQNIAIYGYGDNPSFPQDNPAIFPGHLIGTGPYRFEYMDKTVTQLAKATKNLNYWNRTALEAAGRFTIDDLFYRFFATSEMRTNALLAGEIDATSHILQSQLTDLPAVKADPLLKYYPTLFDPSIDCINMLATEGLDTAVNGLPNLIGSGSGVNYTTLEGMTPRQMFPLIAEDYGFPAGTELPGGINRTVRRAMSYSFDYQSFNLVSYADGDGIWTTSPFGMGSIFYDESVPHPYYNVTKGREILLSDPYYAAQCAARGLGMTNSSTDWSSVGNTNPIKNYSLLSAVTSVKPPFVEQALNLLGFTVTVSEVPNIYVSWVATGRAVIFDMFDYIWLNDATDPMGFFGSGMNLLYKSTSLRIPFNLFNFHHIQNNTIDHLMTEIPFAGTNAQALANQLSDALMNYHAPWLYLGQHQNGVAVNSGWKVTQDALEYPGPKEVGINFAWIGGEIKLEMIFELISPENKTHTTLENGGLPLEYSSNLPLNWTSYSLDNKANVTFSGNTTIPMPINGPHSIQVFGNDSQGNMNQTEIRYFSVDIPFELINPQNITYTTFENGGLTIDYYFPRPLAWMGYSLDDGANITFSGNTTIPMPNNGDHYIQVFGNDSQGFMYQTEIRYFSVDLSIKLINPQDITYTALENGGLTLEYYFCKPLNWTGYSLDDGTSVTFSGNSTIPMPSNGLHSIQLYGSDSDGNVYVSEKTYFIIDYWEDVPPPDIPGFSISIVFITCLLSTIGLVYITKNSRKFKK